MPPHSAPSFVIPVCTVQQDLKILGQSIYCALPTVYMSIGAVEAMEKYPRKALHEAGNQHDCRL